MAQHPRDEEGRPIPDASWPPGREAPGRLEQVRRFLNTVNRENGADHLGEPARAARWLAGAGWATAPTARELAELRRFRDELLGAVRAMDGGRAVEWPTATWRAELRLEPSNDGLHVAGSGTGSDRMIGDLLGIVVEARIAGTLRRLRICAHCQWSYYDRSRNVIGQWCSMSACGQRQKMRRYRSRQRADDA